MALAALLYAACLVVVTREKWRTGNEVDVLPSLGWAAIMVLPFVVQKDHFSQAFLLPQTVGVFLIGLALLVGDLYCGGRQVRTVRLTANQIRWAGFVLFGSALFLQVLHLLLMPEVPLFVRLSGPVDFTTYTLLREQSSKLLDVPEVLKYACQQSLLVLSPLALMILLASRKWPFACLLFVTSLLYSRLTLARGPLYVFIAVCLTLTYVRMSQKQRRGAAAGLLLGALAAGAYGGFVLLSHPLSPVNYRVPREQRPDTAVAGSGAVAQPFTIGDHLRVEDPSYRTLGLVERMVFFLAYRVFLVPSEVSHRWYMYYPRVHGSFLGFDGLTPASRNRPGFQHPANKVGLWAYVHRFPAHYLPTVRAYASVDADAYARWGYGGLVGIALLTLGLRVGGQIVRLEGFLGDSVHAMVSILLAVNLPVASLAATLVAQGVLGLLLLPPFVSLIAFIGDSRAR